MKKCPLSLLSSASRALAVFLLGGWTAVQAGSFSSDFSAGVPAGSTAHGSATVSGEILELTPAANFQSGSLVLHDLDAGAFVKSFTASFQ